MSGRVLPKGLDMRHLGSQRSLHPLAWILNKRFLPLPPSRVPFRSLQSTERMIDWLV